MALHRKYSFIDTFVSYDPSDDQRSISEQRWGRATVSTNPWMNKIKPFFNGNKNDDGPECRNRVRYIRDSCKVFADLWKTEKEFLNKSIDSDISKAFKEFRSSEIARGYYSSEGSIGTPSILNSTIEDLISIHEHIDDERRKWLEGFKLISEQAKEKQSTIRQVMSDLRDSYDRAQRKFETADANFRKFQNRSDRISVPNYEERYRELEDIRTECDQARALARDTYATETYRISSEEHSIARDFFTQFLFDEQVFYNDIQKYLSNQIPKVQNRLETDRLAPSFHCDLAEHCLKRIQRPIAYPIETCICLLKKSVREEGLFRIAPAHGKQKKLVTELDLQLIDKNSKLIDLGYDAHVAASTLKQYLRELPDCLLTDELLPQWNEVPSLSTEDARVQRIGDLINQLPQVNYDNLSYLIRFLSRVAEHSSINKMTASNLGICIGCSLLYAKEQPSNPSLPTSYTNSSTIIELMITHHKKLFPSNNPTDIQPPNRPQPDIIPVFVPSKKQSPSIENLIDIDGPEPSPRPTRKPPAPRPPVVARQYSIPNETPYSQQNYAEETSTDQFPSEQLTVSSTSPTLSMIRKDHSRNGSIGSELDRPDGPPPLPPLVRHRISNHRKEENAISLTSPTSNDGVQVGKSTPDLNTRMANSNINSGQTNNIRISSRDNDTPTSPEEITQF